MKIAKTDTKRMVITIDESSSEDKKNKYTVQASYSLPHVLHLARFIEHTTGTTYPSKTLERRLKLLTDKERIKILTYWAKVSREMEKFEDTIARRADIEEDPWP